MEYIYDWFSQFQPQGQAQVSFNIFIAATMIFALLNTFLGFKLTKLWSTLIGIVIGFVAGFFIGDYIWHNSGIALICAVVLAIVLGALAFFIYKAGVFLMCGAAVFGLVFMLMNAYAVDNFVLDLVVAIVIGVLAGILSIILMRPFIIITTSLGGGFSFAHSLFTLLPTELSAQTQILGLSWPVLLVGAVIAVIGVVVQFITTKKHRG